jgi:predicted MFS family arabinose efflux permease
MRMRRRVCAPASVDDARSEHVRGLSSSTGPVDALMAEMQAANRRRVVWSVYLVGAVDCADAALLPGCFRSLETEMGLTPSTLAELVLAQSVAGALASPLWGYVVDTGGWERRDLLVFGCLWWAAASILSGLALGFWSLLLARTLLGVALPLVSPLSQSIIADLFDEQTRGKAFGAAAMWCTVGTAVGGIGGTALSNRRVPIPMLGGSIAGWRAVFVIGGMCCCLVAGHVAWFCPTIPRAAVNGNPATEPRSWVAVGRAVARNRTWQLLTLQSLFGGLPFAAFHFLTLLMQYAGYQDAVAAVLLGAHRVGSAIGSLVGGHIGDSVAAAGYNRVRVAQGSVVWLLVWLLVLIAALERNIASGGSHGALGIAHTAPVSPLTLALILFTWGLGGK